MSTVNQSGLAIDEDVNSREHSASHTTDIPNREGPRDLILTTGFSRTNSRHNQFCSNDLTRLKEEAKNTTNESTRVTWGRVNA